MDLDQLLNHHQVALIRKPSARQGSRFSVVSCCERRISRMRQDLAGTPGRYWGVTQSPDWLKVASPAAR